MSDGWSFSIPQNVMVRDVPSEDGEIKQAIFPDSLRISFGSMTSEKKAVCFADSLAKESLNYCNSICQGSSITSTAQCFPYLDSKFGLCGTIMVMSDIGAITSFHALIQKSHSNQVLSIYFSPHSRVKRGFVDSILSQIDYRL